ncbi:MAG: flagellar hook-length control protein FliK [Cohaesibacteraceae bacterium]|nr:flagellar hook-length control protein FliK [Cohaesibacteraceae bacterium]MBL4876376.1 flagellar hook-length control protein FliK [Cohaesibacteraceae bacterium]
MQDHVVPTKSLIPSSRGAKPRKPVSNRQFSEVVAHFNSANTSATKRRENTVRHEPVRNSLPDHRERVSRSNSPSERSHSTHKPERGEAITTHDKAHITGSPRRSKPANQNNNDTPVKTVPSTSRKISSSEDPGQSAILELNNIPSPEQANVEFGILEQITISENVGSGQPETVDAKIEPNGDFDVQSDKSELIVLETDKSDINPDKIVGDQDNTEVVINGTVPPEIISNTAQDANPDQAIGRPGDNGSVRSVTNGTEPDTVIPVLVAKADPGIPGVSPEQIQTANTNIDAAAGKSDLVPTAIAEAISGIDAQKAKPAPGQLHVLAVNQAEGETETIEKGLFALNNEEPDAGAGDGDNSQEQKQGAKPRAVPDALARAAAQHQSAPSAAGFAKNIIESLDEQSFQTDRSTLNIQDLMRQESSQTQLSGKAIPASVRSAAESSLVTNISRHIKNGLTRFEIRMDPPELGRVDVRVKIDSDGQMRTHMFIERSETMDFLMRDAKQLERMLGNTGLDLEKDGLTFSLMDEGGQFSDSLDQNHDDENNSGNNGDINPDRNNLDVTEEFQRRNFVSADGLDLFV